MLDNLFQYDDHARLVPQMASVIPTLANGGIKDAGKTIVLRLKPGLRWSNGAEITSHDIKFGWQVGMDSATGPACQGSCDLIKSIDTPSRSIAILHLHRIDSSAIPGALPQVWPPVWPGAWKNNAHAAAVKLGSDPNYTFEGLVIPPTAPTRSPRSLPVLVLPCGPCRTTAARPAVLEYATSCFMPISP
jgi:peptide/nickel transport system substrate-binding protein